VVAAVVLGLDRAVQPADRRLEDRAAGRGGPVRDVSSCSSPRMLMTMPFAGRIRGQVDEERAGQNATSGGSRDTEMNELAAIPCRSPSWLVVTTTTPVG
jgi:hypothetical protein